ncbi:MAG TPA: hypothetical protein VGE15_07875 [Sphingobacteriaceae bacterium]
MKKIVAEGCRKVSLMSFIILMHLHAIAQDVADSDLSNRADSNKNFRDQWWLYGVILLVAVIVLLGVVRRRNRKI